MSATNVPTILLVDDMQDNIDLLRRILKPKGYSVLAALGGAQALDIVRATPPDVVLLDLVMPGMDGYEVCRRLKQDPRTRHIPVIIVTGQTEREANLKALEAGADDFVVKPVDAALLEVRIRNAVAAKVLHDQILAFQRELEQANEQLEQRVQERTREIERTQQVTVFSLAKLAESRDTETGDHLDRMRCYALETAREMVKLPKYRASYDESFARRIYQSSPLHDIGKVGIPDAILLKPGKLSDEEFEIMKTHTIIGGDTLKAADVEAGTNSFLTMGRDIAYYHHEKWDGAGYPFGLRGEDIPLEARIVAVGDVYDALSSKRPYKEPFTHEKSMAIIREGRGTHFDPEVVDAFFRCEPKVLEIRRRYQDTGRLAPLELLVRQIDRLRATKPAG